MPQHPGGRNRPQRVHFNIGTGLGPATGTSGLTTQLAGASIYIGGTAAFLTYAQNGQVNAWCLSAYRVLKAQLFRPSTTAWMGNTVTVPVVNASPGIFTQAYGPGQAWMVNQDNTFIQVRTLLRGTPTWRSG